MNHLLGKRAFLHKKILQFSEILKKSECAHFKTKI